MKPVRATAALPFRLLVPCGALFLAALLVPGKAGAGWGVEITPYAGYRVGGGFEDNVTGVGLDVKEGGSFGLILDLSDRQGNEEQTQYELFYGLQRTRVTAGGTFGGEPLFDLDIHYLHVGGTYAVPGERVHPYVAGGLGATHFAPHGSGLDSKTHFSVSLGGGVKVPVSRHVGLRIEGRGFLTILPDSAELFCVSSGGAACRAKVRGDAFGQFLFLAGVSFSL